MNQARQPLLRGWRTRVAACSQGAVCARNEDHVGHVARDGRLAAWVIDGASPLVEAGRIHGSSSMDVQWFVREIERYLHENSLGAAESRTMFTQAVDAVYKAYLLLAREGIDTPLFERPLAAVSWVRINFKDHHAELEYLGDCPLFVMSAEGSVLLEAAGDATAESVVRDKVRDTLRYEDPLEAAGLIEHLKLRRARQHTDPSAGVFAMAPGTVERGLHGILRMEQPFDVVMITDGLFRLVDLFGRYSPAGFCARCVRGDFESLISELRKLENTGESRWRFPRLKRSDDASGVLIQCRNSDLCLDRRAIS